MFIAQVLLFSRTTPSTLGYKRYGSPLLLPFGWSSAVIVLYTPLFL